jgi:2-desacetyl-2-hydroxyethyl bacteriochlorophyllide A dehydrogenase
MERRLVIPEPGSVLIEWNDLPTVGPGEIRVQIEQSLISTGTEMTAYSGLFDADSHWGAYVQYPFHPGYSSAGQVTETGPDVMEVKALERIFTMWPHASGHVLPQVAAFPIPAEISLEQANWCALAGVAYVGICRAAIAPGESVAVIGAGPVGQMATRWAGISGAGRVTVIDPAAGRLELALAGGATTVIRVPVSEARQSLFEANHGHRPPVVIDTTGRAATLAEALPLVADFGRFVLVGDAGNPTEQHLTSDIISRGIQIMGTHGNYMPYVIGQRNLAQREGLSQEQVLAERVLGWRAFSALFFDLVCQNRFPLDGLISHSFSSDDAAQAYALLSERRTETMGIALTW